MSLVDPETMFRSAEYADVYKVQMAMKYMRAGAHWIQGKLKNAPINYRESFTDELLTITVTIKVSELLAMKEAEKPKAPIDNRKFH